MQKTTAFVTPPRGLLRFGLRLPIWLYRLHLGWLLGEHFLLLTHTGRNSGRLHQTVIEVVKYDQLSRSFFVVSGWGQKADWYQNIHKDPDVVINSGRQQLQVHAEDVAFAEAADILDEYSGRYGFGFKVLTRLFLGEEMQPGREASERLAAMMPAVCFRPRQ
jgi:deazaflavin-dependent oxidoreductase (nitroreductase family)